MKRIPILFCALAALSLVAADYAAAGKLRGSRGGGLSHTRFEGGGGHGGLDRQRTRDSQRRGFEGGVSRAERRGTFEQRGGQQRDRSREFERGDGREERRDERTERQETRQGERTERSETRQRERSERVEDRMETRREIAEDIHDNRYWRHHHHYYHHHDDWWDYDDDGWALFWGITLGAFILSLPPRYETVYVSETTYYYANGTYYQDSGDGYTVVPAPAGATVEHAPTDITMVTSGEDEYGYSNGAYYEAEVSEEGEAQFEVVEPPVGAIVPSLPEGAETREVAGKEYFVYAGTFYQPFYSGSSVVYMVVEDPAG